jgi:hypothetical protein
MGLLDTGENFESDLKTFFCCTHVTNLHINVLRATKYYLLQRYQHTKPTLADVFQQLDLLVPVLRKTKNNLYKPSFENPDLNICIDFINKKMQSNKTQKVKKTCV